MTDRNGRNEKKKEREQRLETMPMVRWMDRRMGRACSGRIVLPLSSLFVSLSGAARWKGGGTALNKNVGAE